MDAPTSPAPVALVAGASRGIGAETAKALALAGYAVATATDVGDVDSMRSLVRLAVSSFGRLDAAFNNATDGPMPAPLADIDVDGFDRGIRTNIRGTFLGMKYQIPAML